MKRLYFIVMVGLWGAFIALALTSPDTLNDAWQWSRDLAWPFQIVIWIVLLPWMIRLWVWQSDWSFGVRLAIVAALAVVTVRGLLAGRRQDRGAAAASR